jgi:hypothetical protein
MTANQSFSPNGQTVLFCTDSNVFSAISRTVTAQPKMTIQIAIMTSIGEHQQPVDSQMSRLMRHHAATEAMMGRAMMMER